MANLVDEICAQNKVYTHIDSLTHSLTQFLYPISNKTFSSSACWYVRTYAMHESRLVYLRINQFKPGENRVKLSFLPSPKKCSHTQAAASVYNKSIYVDEIIWFNRTRAHNKRSILYVIK